MKRERNMTPFTANPAMWILSAVLVAAAVAYFAYGWLDRVGLDVRTVEARVTSKQYTEGRSTYRTTVVNGRAWTQVDDTGDVYGIVLDVAGEPTVGLVTKELYDSLADGDRVSARVRRTRFSHRLEVVHLDR